MPYRPKRRPSAAAPAKAPRAPRKTRAAAASSIRAQTAQRGERLQKVLAAAGLGSRRKCEELIVAGRVEVDRQVVRELGVRVQADKQEVRVDGSPIERNRLVHYLVYKPVGLLSTNRDPSGRARVIDLLPPSRERLFTVGRLDMGSEGLMLVTNDGELAHRLAHPRYGVEKTYLALVAGAVDSDLPGQLMRGVHLAEGRVQAVGARVKSRLKQSTLLEIVLNEGKNREIRRLLARLGHKVLTLKRTAFGGVKLADLKPGEYRRLRHDELKTLRDAARSPRAVAADRNGADRNGADRAAAGASSQ